MAYALTMTGVTLKFCAGFGPDWHLLFCMPLVCVGSRSKWRCLGLEAGAATDNLT